MFYDDINKVSLSGYLTREAEIVSPKEGNAFAKASLAVNKSWMHNQEVQKSTEYFTVIFNFKHDIKMITSLSVGDRIYVDGELKVRKWQGEDGVNRSAAFIAVNHLKILQQNTKLANKDNEVSIASSTEEVDGSREVNAK